VRLRPHDRFHTSSSFFFLAAYSRFREHDEQFDLALPFPGAVPERCPNGDHDVTPAKSMRDLNLGDTIHPSARSSRSISVSASTAERRLRRRDVTFSVLAPRFRRNQTRPGFFPPVAARGSSGARPARSVARACRHQDPHDPWPGSRRDRSSWYSGAGGRHPVAQDFDRTGTTTGGRGGYGGHGSPGLNPATVVTEPSHGRAQLSPPTGTLLPCLAARRARRGHFESFARLKPPSPEWASAFPPAARAAGRQAGPEMTDALNRQAGRRRRCRRWLSNPASSEHHRIFD